MPFPPPLRMLSPRRRAAASTSFRSRPSACCEAFWQVSLPMRFEDYPPQEPGSPGAEVYRRTCIERSFGVPFTERRFGGDPHQSVAIYPAVVHGRPLFIFIHGGGWAGGYKETMAFMAP